jgi:uncharacterized membrane protein
MEFLVFIMFLGILGLFARLETVRGQQRETSARLEIVEQWVRTTLMPGAQPQPQTPAAPAPVFEPEPEPEFETEFEPAFSASSYASSEPDAPPAPAYAFARERSTLERMLAEHALSIVGGVFVLVAAIFFVSWGIDQGWIGPGARIALAIVFGIALTLIGMRRAAALEPTDRTGRAIGSLHGVLAGVGIAVVFLAIIGAVRIEELFSATVGVALQIVAAACAVALARSWKSQDLAAFGLTVALAAPILVDAPADGGSIVLLTVALIGTALVAVLEQWPRMLAVAVLVTAPQLLSFADSTTLSSGAGLSVVLAWWALLTAASIVCALRDEHAVPRSAVGTILAAPVVVVAAFEAILAAQHTILAPTDRVLPLTLFALVQLLMGLLTWQLRRPRLEPLTIALVGAALTTAALAFGNAADGGPVTAAWAAEAVALAAIWWRTRSLLSLAFTGAMSIAALVQAFVVVAPPTLLGDDTVTLTQPLVSLAAIAIAAVVAALLARRIVAEPSQSEDATMRMLDLLAAATVWYAGTLTLSILLASNVAPFAIGIWSAATAALAIAAAIRFGRIELAIAALVAVGAEFAALVLQDHATGTALLVYAPAAIVAALVADRSRSLSRAHRNWLIWGAALQAALALLVVLQSVPPTTLRAWDGSTMPDLAWQLALAVLAIAAVALVTVRARLDPVVVRSSSIAAALTALYAVSVLVVAAFSARPDELEQSAQLALTLTWVAIAIAALVAGTSARYRAQHELRIAAYSLFALAAVKLVLVDTVDFETPARVAAFLLTGLGLLGAAAIEQRMRTDDRR